MLGGIIVVLIVACLTVIGFRTQVTTWEVTKVKVVPVEKAKDGSGGH